MSIDVSKVRYISLIRFEGGESLLNLPYAELTVDPDLIAGFVTAVIIFAKTPIRTIRKAAYDILIEVGKTTLVLLVVDPIPDETPYRTKLQRIINQVEEEHGKKLESFEGDVRGFREFAISVLKEFPYFLPDIDLVPIMKKNGISIPYRVGKVDSKLERVESFINGKRTVSEILDLINLPEDEVMALTSILGKYRWIFFKRRLTENDVLTQSKCPSVKLDSLMAQYGEPLTELMKQFETPSKVKDVLDALPFDRNACWFIVNKLLEMECLKMAES
ncbi:MAG: hypothetical protein P1Q69_11270 [Candidatus Thorarchaeota archaeon]|nr:hypothetical protein [Candidatus Thorarchaeota archaeon]